MKFGKITELWGAVGRFKKLQGCCRELQEAVGNVGGFLSHGTGLEAWKIS